MDEPMNDRDRDFGAALEALAAARPEARDRRLRDAFKAATVALDLCFAAATRNVPRSSVEDARQITLIEFFVGKPLDTIDFARAPGLLRTIFRRRVIDQIRRGCRGLPEPGQA